MPVARFRLIPRLLSWLAITVGACAAQGVGDGPLELDFTELMQGKNVLFVGAHPDDEFEFAPMLAEACLFNGATCHFVIASEAHSVGCSLAAEDTVDPDECSEVRREEMRRSAALLGGEVTFFGWEDLFYSHDAAGLALNLAQWAADNGGHDALVARFRSVLDERQPDIVLTLDPRHGSSCHPNHRAVAKLLFEAIAGLPPSTHPDVWLEADFWIAERLEGELKDIFMRGGIIPWPGVDTPLYWYDATKRLPNGHEAWDYLVEVQRVHRSQFPSLADGRPAPWVPREFRRIPLVRAADIDPDDELCEPLGLAQPAGP